jgi:hypothetical protein
MPLSMARGHLSNILTISDVQGMSWVCTDEPVHN